MEMTPDQKKSWEDEMYSTVRCRDARDKKEEEREKNNTISKIFVWVEYPNRKIERGIGNTMAEKERKMLLSNLEESDIIYLARDICYSFRDRTKNAEHYDILERAYSLFSNACPSDDGSEPEDI